MQCTQCDNNKEYLTKVIFRWASTIHNEDPSIFHCEYLCDSCHSDITHIEKLGHAFISKH